MARKPSTRPAPRRKRSDELVVNLEEFASLCGVTPETMRAHLKAAPANASWIIKRGRRGSGYQIAAHGGITWWKEKTAGAGDAASKRSQQLAQLRLQMLGGDAAEEELLLTGKQRYDEFRAGEAELSYRQAIGELVRAADVEAEISNAVIELRRQLQRVGTDVARQLGLDRSAAAVIDDMIAAKLNAFVEALDSDDAASDAE